MLTYHGSVHSQMTEIECEMRLGRLSAEDVYDACCQLFKLLEDEHKKANKQLEEELAYSERGLDDAENENSRLEDKILRLEDKIDELETKLENLTNA